jgi:hypothetical protein
MLEPEACGIIRLNENREKEKMIPSSYEMEEENASHMEGWI